MQYLVDAALRRIEAVSFAHPARPGDGGRQGRHGAGAPCRRGVVRRARAQLVKPGPGAGRGRGRGQRRRVRRSGPTSLRSCQHQRSWSSSWSTACPRCSPEPGRSRSRGSRGELAASERPGVAGPLGRGRVEAEQLLEHLFGVRAKLRTRTAGAAGARLELGHHAGAAHLAAVARSDLDVVTDEHVAGGVVRVGEVVRGGVGGPDGARPRPRALSPPRRVGGCVSTRRPPCR